MKKILCLLTILALLLAGCQGGGTPYGLQPSREQPSTAAPESSLPTEPSAPESAPETTEPLPFTEPTETEPEAPDTEAPAPSTEAPEPVDPWSLLEERSFEQGAYTDNIGNQYTYSYALPGIAGNSSGARAINAVIDNSFGDLIREAKREMEEGLSLGCPSVGYYAAVWEDILTLVVIAHWDWSFDDYGVYCYEVSTDRWLSGAELLERMGVSQEEFLESCRRQFRQTFKDQYAELPQENLADYGYYEALDRCDGDKYVNMELQFYPDETGDLVVIAPIVSLAGADYYYHPIHLGLGGMG